MSEVFDSLLELSDRMYRVDREPPPMLYHYASTAAVMSMLQAREMWASDLRFQNDPRELKYAYEVFDAWRRKKSISRLCEAVVEQAFSQETARHAFSLSFSAERDLLSQWRAYGEGGRGLCIGVDTYAIKAAQHVVASAETRLLLFPVIYDLSAQEDYLDRIFGAIFHVIDSAGPTEPEEDVVREAASFMRSYFYPLRVMFKHSAYRDEGEWRFVKIQPHRKMSDVRVRVNGANLIPYLPLRLAVDASGNASFPLREIVLGPGRNVELDRAALEIFLTSNGYGDVAVMASAIAFRG